MNPSVMQRPAETIGQLDGLYYKIGHRQRAFYWDGNEWVKSDKSAHQVKSRLELKSKPKGK